MSITDTFDPDRNGWIFENWGESTAFSWDLFRLTYIGINPTQDIVAAPLDCAFYEIFKDCAAQGNCGGMSLLALAMFKHGGWMARISTKRSTSSRPASSVRRESRTSWTWWTAAT